MTKLPSKAEVLIEVHDMKKVYGEGESAVEALKGVSLTVHRGEFVSIMGASGSGKSTFMHLLGCLDHPTSGSYKLEGLEVSGLTSDLLARVRGRYWKSWAWASGWTTSPTSSPGASSGGSR
jgi:putative ABC transport system ATP-binding protein